MMWTCSVRLWIAAACVTALCLPAWAITWNEAGDAGDLPGSAQVTTGNDTLDVIFGDISHNSDVDMYRIYIDGGGTFSAFTLSPFDPQLFLFDAAGMGVYSDDDGLSPQPLLPAGGLSPTLPGIYYLAISAWNNDAVSPGGLIFPTPNDADNGPTGPGGGQPISGWDGNGYDSGSYTILLTGARTADYSTGGPGPVVPEPLTLAGAVLGLAGLGGYLRKRKRT